MKINLKKIIVTSGPTREFLDPIRYLSNPSTGQMGFSIAKAGLSKGYKVSFISGPVSSAYSQIKKAKNAQIISTRDMLQAVVQEIEPECALIMAAAPADFRPEKSFSKKIKKKETHGISLVNNPDILKEVGSIIKQKSIKNFFLIGFAAETHEGEEYALQKLREKNLDIIFLNDLSQKNSGFGVNTNCLTVFRKDLVQKQWDVMSKKRLGHKIIQEIENYIVSPKKQI